MMAGLPYSGKSIMAARLADTYNAVIHSSDDIRAEILGDEKDQTANTKVFEILHSRVIQDLKGGKSVIYDATNISYKRRMDFLKRIENISCVTICVFMATPFELCVERMNHRERVVPYEVLERMYRSIWVPGMYEGWSDIWLKYPDGFKLRSVDDLFHGENGLNHFAQDNPHHTLTVGHHCITAYGAVDSDIPEVQEAALLHDIGKPFTKTFVNKKGETTPIAHYYDHQHISAYDSLFYCDPKLDQIQVANLIQWHMRPYEIKRSDNPAKVADKFKALVGEQMFNDIMKIHEADVKAH